MTTAAPSPSPSIPSTSGKNGRPLKKRRTLPPPAGPSHHSHSAADLPENLTHTSQAALPESGLAHDPITIAQEAGEEAGWPGYPGLSDDEVFRRVTAPRQIEGVEGWGIPDVAREVDPALQVSRVIRYSLAEAIGRRWARLA